MYGMLLQINYDTDLYSVVNDDLQDEDVIFYNMDIEQFTEKVLSIES